MNIKLPGTAFLVASILFACNDDKAAHTKPSVPQTYNELTLAPRTTTIYSDFPATIEGIEIVQLRPMVDGYLEKIYIPEGAEVKKGQLLFKIENPVYDEAVVTAKAT